MGRLVAVAMVTAAVIGAVIWFLPAPWWILLPPGLGSTVLLLSPTPRWIQDGLWRNWPVGDQLRNRLPARWQRWRSPLAGLAGTTMVAGLVVLWVKAPDLYITRDPEKSAGATATTRAGILTLGAAIAAGLVAWVSLAETRRANRASDEREAQVTDRYTKAIGQLGDPQLAIRLGGIYALERIVHDSKRDHRTIVEVLSAFIRTSSQPTTSNSSRSPDNQSNAQPKEQLPSAALPAGDTRRSLPIDGSRSYRARRRVIGAAGPIHHRRLAGVLLLSSAGQLEHGLLPHLGAQQDLLDFLGGGTWPSSSCTATAIFAVGRCRC